MTYVSSMNSDSFSPVFGDSRSGGAANRRPDELPPDPRPANTAVAVLYRDASNYKVSDTVVLTGRYEDEDLKVIQAKLDDGQFFIPSQVGLNDLHGQLQQYDSDASLDANGINEDDHPWHELDLPDAVTRTDEEPTTTLTWAELVDNFATVAWDPDAVDLSQR